MSLYITEHAYDRARKRFKIKKRTLKKMAHRAFVSKKNESFNKYVKNHPIRGMNKNDLKLHGEIVYVFDEKTLVTVHKIPKDWRK
jgi:hypothetical protein